MRATILDGSGIKSSLLWDEETDAWRYYSNEPEHGAPQLYRTIPTLYRAIEKNADALSKIPFSIFRGDTEIDNSQDWQNKLEYLPNPRRLFSLLCRSLDKSGSAYLLKVKNKAGYVKELKWLAASTIDPQINETSGLTSFKRQVGSRIIEYTPDDLVYFWLPDDDVEIGPPKRYPVKAALQASGVLHYLDGYIQLYFERGAIRPLIISAKGMPSPEERQRLETWFNRLMAGIKRAFSWKIFNADTLSFQQIGDGLDQLQNQTLTSDQRFDVALALGIPQTILFANAANYATSLNDYRAWYDATVVPRAEFIASTMNEQLFSLEKYRLEFSPESLDIYQEDENERANAVNVYVNAGMPLLMACDILGVELTEEQRAELEAEKQAKEERAEELQEQLQNQPPQSEQENEQPEMSEEARAEAKRWKRTALQALRKGKPLPADWIADAIPAEMAAQIAEGMKAATCADDVLALFDCDHRESEPMGDLAAELKRANDLLEAVHVAA